MKKINHVISEIKLSFLPKIQPDKRVSLRSPDLVVDFLYQIWSDQLFIKEEFKILFLDRQMRLIGYHNLSCGGMHCTMVDTKILYSLCLKSMAHAIILCHNHPNCTLNPSDEDINLTR